MNIEIIGFRLPTITPDPSRHSSCGWIAICDGKEVGWCNMSFLPDNTLKFEDSFVHPDYRGRGIYKMLWNKRMDYYNAHLTHYKIISYCKPTTLKHFLNNGFTIKENITLVERLPVKNVVT